jgi:hypothetical protein
MIGIARRRVAGAAVMCALVATLGLAMWPAATSARAPALLQVQWMPGFQAPGTPARLNKVGVLKIGRPSARNVLVFEPGTTAGSAYIVPFAQWLTRTLPNWQVWSVERRENLLEDQSVLTAAKEHRATAKQVFDYYLNFLVDHHIRKHVAFLTATQDTFAKNWGVNVAVQDLRIVIRAAKRLGGRVVLSGHSLGGALVTAYATYDFGGRAGARDLAGLVFDDGAGFAPVTATKARQDLAGLMARASSPWGGISGGVAAPLLGIYASTGALAAVQQPNAPAIGQTFSALPSYLNPGVPVTNLALFAYNTDVATSKLGVFAVLAHEGKGLGPANAAGVHGWNGAGALTPAGRWATMLSGSGVANADGVEWYFPTRLTIDSFDAVGTGLPSPAQKVLDVRATMGRKLPRTLRMFAFGAYGGAAITQAAVTLARQSHIPMSNLLLINRHGTYAHNDPAGAFPKNAFFTGLVHFLRQIDAVG